MYFPLCKLHEWDKRSDAQPQTMDSGVPFCSGIGHEFPDLFPALCLEGYGQHPVRRLHGKFGADDLPLPHLFGEVGQEPLLQQGLGDLRVDFGPGPLIGPGGLPAQPEGQGLPRGEAGGPDFCYFIILGEGNATVSVKRSFISCTNSLISKNCPMTQDLKISDLIFTLPPTMIKRPGAQHGQSWRIRLRCAISLSTPSAQSSAISFSMGM